MDGNLFHQGTMIGGGGQDTPAGVSWPPPKTAFWKFLQKRFSSHWKAVLFSIVLDVYNYSFIWQMDGNLFHQGTMIGGGGQDTPAGVSWPPPKTAFWKFLQKRFSSHWKAVLFSIVLDVYNYSFIWQMDGNLFHQGTMIGGGGQDTPAGVSWPPPKTAFWKFLQKRFFVMWKAVLFSIVLDIYNYSFIWQNPWKFVSSGDNDRGWGSRYPSWGILTPTKDCILKIFTKKVFSSHWKAVLFSIVLDEIITALFDKWMEICFIRGQW